MIIKSSVSGDTTATNEEIEVIRMVQNALADTLINHPATSIEDLQMQGSIFRSILQAPITADLHVSYIDPYIIL